MPTLGPAYNEFGYYEHPLLCIKIIDSNVKKFTLHLFVRFKQDSVYLARNSSQNLLSSAK